MSNRHKKKKRKKKIPKQKNTIKVVEKAPVDTLVAAVKKHKVKILPKLGVLLLTVLFGVNFVSLSVLGIPTRYIIEILPRNLLGYIPAAISFFLCLQFIAIVEAIVRTNVRRKALKCSIYITNAVLNPIIVGISFSFTVDIILVLCLFTMFYTGVYLLAIRPHYSKKHRNLASTVLTNSDKKYRPAIYIADYVLILGHILIIGVLIGNIYSILPRYHFLNATTNEIVIASNNQNILVGAFIPHENDLDNTQLTTSSVYIVPSSIRFTRFSDEEFSLNQERLFIRPAIREN